jgi:hypothetical protein
MTISAPAKLHGIVLGIPILKNSCGSNPSLLMAPTMDFFTASCSLLRLESAGAMM